MSLRQVSSDTVLSLYPDGTYEVTDIRYLPKVADCIAVAVAAEERVITVHIGNRVRTVCPSCGIDKITAMLKGDEEQLLRVAPDGSYDADEHGCLHTIAEQALELASRLRLAKRVVVNYSRGSVMVKAGQEMGDVILDLNELRLGRRQLPLVA